MVSRRHQLSLYRLWGTIARIAPGRLGIIGVSEHVGVGDEFVARTEVETVRGEVLSVAEDEIIATPFSSCASLRIGDKVEINPNARIAPNDSWLGRIVDYRGVKAGDQACHTSIGVGRPLICEPAPADRRRGLGAQLNTGWMATDTLLPVCKGQRVGVFAGSGVGKSTFLASLASGINAERIVVALIGERSREVSEFAQKTLPRSIADRTVIVAATASEPPGAKKRAAYCAVAAAEHFRDEGHHVLLLFDSITRFAEAHRETALAVGETPALNAFPPSTTRVVAELVERVGPGGPGQGDISAVFSVLVAGSNMEEPVADMVRGLLDGHIVLSRDIAERGRFPAIDALKSVSRSSRQVTSEAKAALIQEAREIIALNADLAPMVRANLYERGKDIVADRALDLFEDVDAFVGSPNPGDVASAFGALERTLTTNTTKAGPGVASVSHTLNEAAQEQVLSAAGSDAGEKG